MIFYFRLITQPCFVLDLNYKGHMINTIKNIRKIPTLPSKQSAKIVLEKRRGGILHFIGVYSVHGDGDTKSIGLSEPDRTRESSHHISGSSIASGNEQEKSSESIVNSYVVKYFGPLFEEYRRLKGDMKFELLGPAAHIPFGKVAIINRNEKAPVIPSGSRKALDLPTNKLPLAAVELKSNDFANSIIDGLLLVPKERLSMGIEKFLTDKGSVHKTNT